MIPSKQSLKEKQLCQECSSITHEMNPISFSKLRKKSSAPELDAQSCRAKQKLLEEARLSRTRLIDLISELRGTAARSGLFGCAKEAVRLSSGVLEKAYLAKLAGRLLGVSMEPTEFIGAAAELLMSSALTVDDWIDHAPIRAGRPSVHVTYGPAMTFLAATFLVEAAHTAVRRGCHDAPINIGERIAELFSHAVLSIQAGQALIEKGDSKSTSANALDHLARLRCGHLIGFVMGSVGLLASAPMAATALKEAGIWIGIALQHRNDIQDFTVAFDQKVKPPMADLLNGQPNLVLSNIFGCMNQLSTTDSNFLLNLYGRNKRAFPEPLSKEEFDRVLQIVSITGAGLHATRQLTRCIKNASGILAENFNQNTLMEWHDYARLLHLP